MWEPENILVVGQEWYTHYKERPDMNDRDDVSYCDINECEDCPRYGDDCDGKDWPYCDDEEEEEYDE